MTIRHRNRILGAALVWTGVAFVFFTFAQPASAIPVFARKYKTSCSTCHTIIPKLNHFGLAFRANGYRIPVNDPKFIKVEDVSLGAPAWKKLWPKEGIWPGAVSGQPPIAIRALLDMNITTNKPVTTNFDFPHEFEILTGGNLGEGVSYFGELEFEGDEFDIARIFINFDNIRGTPLLNVRVGRFETVATPFSRFYRRLTSADYNISSDYQIKAADFAVSGSDKGFRFKDRQQGLEFYGARTGPDNRGGFEYGIGIVNGSGSSKDTNSHKDFEWSLAYKFWGYGVTGPIGEEEVESLQIADNFVDNSIKIGAFGYVGRIPFAGSENRYRRTGIKVDAFFQKLNLYGAIVWGEDKLLTPRRIVDSSAWFLEADYVLTPWIIPLVRFEKTDIEGRPDSIKRVIPALNLALRANVRLLIEGRFTVRDKGIDPALLPRNEGRVRLDIVF
ncbi:MAG: hypothetical protein ACE5IP_04540 [Terriglobia bacterium]